MFPTKLELGDERTALLITWSDGSVREYAVGELREKCPCASCRENRIKGDAPADVDSVQEPAGTMQLPVLSLQEARPLAIADVQPVGNYAYSIHFSDGHSTGIFTLKHLRALGREK